MWLYIVGGSIILLQVVTLVLLSMLFHRDKQRNKVSDKVKSLLKVIEGKNGQ